MAIVDREQSVEPAGEALRNTVSIDIGGTFTDCFVSYQGKTASGKAPTTRHRLASGFNQAIADCAESLEIEVEDLLSDTDLVRYATTLAMNALLERKGPKLGLVTTAGFEDTIFIGRGAQWHDGLPVEYKRMTARGQRPEPVIPRHMVVGIRERIDDEGKVVIPLNEDEVRQAIRTLVDQGAMGFVVVLMQAHRNPSHELQVRDILRQEYPETYLGSQPILLASEVLPRQAEYARNMTTILAAYLHRTMAEELTELANSLQERGYRRPLFIVNSQGGANPLHRTSAVETYNAGPVAGVIGGAHLARIYGIDNIILSDMGGTSFDIATVVNVGRAGDEAETSHFYAYQPMVDRFRTGISMIETKSIGAGGGSIARFNEMLKIIEVGPESAGSNPGPACFDMGGELPTVTDADVVLGYIRPDYFLGGKIELNGDAAVEAVTTHLAEPLGKSVDEAAYLVKTIVDANMGNEVFKETNLKGYDPREFSLLAFGGAGPAHAAGYASYIGAKQVLISPHSSVFSAFGVSNTDFMRSYERACALKIYEAPTDSWLENFEAFNEVVESLRGEALRDVEELGVSDVLWRLELAMRYGLQPHVTRIRSPRIEVRSTEDVQEIYRAFETEYSRIYSPAATYQAGGVEVLGMTLWSIVPADKIPIPQLELEGEDPDAAKTGERLIYWGPERGREQTRVYQLDRLRPGNRVVGPAIVEAVDTTVVVEPGWTFQIDQRGSGVMKMEA